MTAPWISRWRVEAGLVGLAVALGGGEGVVDFQDGAFGAVVAVELLLVLALYDREGVHDAGHGIAGRLEGLRQGDGLLAPLVSYAEVRVEKGSFYLAAYWIPLVRSRAQQRRSTIRHEAKCLLPDPFNVVFSVLDTHFRGPTVLELNENISVSGEFFPEFPSGEKAKCQHRSETRGKLPV